MVDRVGSVVAQRVELHRPDPHVIRPVPGEAVVPDLEVAGTADADVVTDRGRGHPDVAEGAFMDPQVETLVQADYREGLLAIVPVPEGAADDLEIQQDRDQVGDRLVV